MLQIKDVKKEYVTGELHQIALAGVSLNLRESELVAILGPSGSGKSTLLNVIGGLDKYDSGDLIINGISTKKYTDRDWDSYRNHTIGFVFQSYNLIPHQSVLSNVELALTISGVPKSERRKRAVKALEDVGLGSQIHKKPSQMSGGQMQRVAIARALVNNPSILLADEPTGALDSETSKQVMELLKEVSRDRLVVMVTHNPELAMEYADRIVRVKDGKIIEDSHPFEVDERTLAQPEHKNMGKSSMSFFSALSLSFNNLKSKKGRTLLTAFAGSIGIIGIALIMALSVGFQRYIDTVQEDTLANNPLTIQAETADLMSVVMPQMGSTSAETDDSSKLIHETPALSNMFQHFGANDMASFKAHLENHYDEIGHTLNSISYYYGIRPRIYVTKPSGIQQVNPAHLFKDLTGNQLVAAVMDADVFQEMTDDRNLLNDQYQILQGRWPENYDEVVFVLPDSGHLSDQIAYTLGLKDLDSLKEMIQLLADNKDVPPETNPMEWTYDELMALDFRLVFAPDLYVKNEEYHVWEDLSKDEAHLAQAVENAQHLKIVGIVSPKPDSVSTALSPGIAYLPSLTRHIIDEAADSQIVQEQLASPDVNVFSGKPFNAEAGQTPIDFDDLISIDSEAISSAFGIDIDENAIMDLMKDYLAELGGSAEVDTSGAQQAFISGLVDFSRQMLGQFVSENAGSDGVATIRLSDLVPMADAYFASDAPAARLQHLADTYAMDAEAFVGVYKPMIVGLLTEHIAKSVSEEAGITAAPAEAETSPAAVPDAQTEPAAAPAEINSAAAGNAADQNSSVPSTPDNTLPDENIDISPDDLSAELTLGSVDTLVAGFPDNPIVDGAAAIMGKKMMEPQILQDLMKKAAAFGDVLAQYFTDSFYVDGEKLSDAFHFNMDESEMKRLMDALSSRHQEQTAQSNLKALGYADLNNPVSMSFYFKDFNAKEEFTDFLTDYNASAEASGHEEQVIRYTDMTAMMMDSVRTIINTVSYCLIAFVGVSLLVSSIMIGIITYISVMERTKEIGILRAMGASKRNISQVFNAETFIIGLCSGLLGVVISLVMLIPGNKIIHVLMETNQITAYLPLINSLALILISMVLTLLGGLIPSHQAAKKDPVIALRSE